MLPTCSAPRPARRRVTLITVGLAVCALAPRTWAQRPQYDLLIRNGLVIDGTGAQRSRMDVGLRGDVIVRIARRIPASAARSVIEARGLIVAPGFIDPHAHITTITAQPDAENFVRQGITTIFNSLHSLDQPYPLAAFLDTLRVTPNTIWSAGHTWVRSRVMGRANREPTPAELQQMRTLVREAIRDGAIGLGTGLEYVPAAYATMGEVIALAHAARAPGAKYVTHLRDEGDGVLRAIAEAIAIGRATQTPVHISHLKVTGVSNWGRSRDALRLIDAATRSGVRTTLDVYPYTAYSTYSDVLFPSWFLADGRDSVQARSADVATRTRLRAEMAPIFRAQTSGRAASVQFRDLPADRTFAGQTLAAYLVARGRDTTLHDVIDALIDLQVAGGFTATVEAMSDADLDQFLRHPAAVVSTDGDLVQPGVGYPHPRSYGAFPRLLSRATLKRRGMTLEATIHTMTQRTANALGLARRGVIRVGAAADVVVFDADQIADVATFSDPHHYATGVRHVVINGVQVMLNGGLTGSRPGHALRRGTAEFRAQ